MICGNDCDCTGRTLGFLGFFLSKILGYSTAGNMKCPLALGKSGSVWDWDRVCSLETSSDVFRSRESFRDECRAPHRRWN